MSSTEETKALYSAPAADDSNTVSAKPPLRATTALLSFLLFIVGQLVVAVVMVVFYVNRFTGGGGSLDDKDAVSALVTDIMPLLALGSVLGGGIGVAIAARMLKSALRDFSINGVALGVGSINALLSSLFLGGIAAVLYLIFPLWLWPPTAGTATGLLAQMAVQPGFGQLVWVVTAVFLAPLIEELLFRGFLLGGFNQSLGIVWGIILSTGLFVVTHTMEAMYYFPAFIGLTLLSLLTTYQRLKWGSITASIVTHSVYNGVLAATLFFR